ncbi:MAG: recombination mediator RecR [Bacteroidales bacterium]|nr:recombination mediator RecR [Bacteroidales bacterium]
MNIPSKILENAVDALSSLPGVGKRSALRYALHLLQSTEMEVEDFIMAIGKLKTDIHYCSRCHCISDTPVCEICSNPKRQQNIICVVENIQDVMAIENTQQYHGLYHVLGGVISPIDGIGINDINIASLIERLKTEEITELILALPTTMEGDTTNFYISKQLQQFPDILVSAIARGIAIGDNLEYADEITLGRSITNRVPFNTIRG